MKTRLGLKPLKVAQPELFTKASPLSVTILRWVDVLTARYHCSKKDAKRLLSAVLGRNLSQSQILHQADSLVFGTVAPEPEIINRQS